MSEFVKGYPKIRRMNERDLPRVVELCHELGYLKADLKSVSESFRLGKTLESHEYYVLVESDFVIASMTLILRVRLEAPPFLQIGTLVIDRNYRGKGLGRMLLAFAEERARAHSLSVVGLMSSSPRIGAHKFYLAAGFEKAKENYFFQKDIV